MLCVACKMYSAPPIYILYITYYILNVIYYILYIINCILYIIFDVGYWEAIPKIYAVLDFAA